MQLTFGQLVEELQGRPSAELDELAELAHKYSIAQRRAEILANAKISEEEYEQGQLKAYDNIDDLMQSLKEEV